MAKEKKNDKKQSIFLRSEPVQEIMGTIPPWLIRWGISLFFIIILGIFIGSWFFKYPDVINAEVEVITQNPPADIVAKVDGKIEVFFIEDNQKVEKRNRLAILENPASYQQIFDLEKALRIIKPMLENQDTIFPEFDYLKYNDLGQIQSYFSLFLKNYLDYKSYKDVDYYLRKIASLEKQIRDYRISYKYMYTQKNTLEEDYFLSKKNYDRNQSLFEQQAIAEVELENVKSEMLGKKHSFEAARTDLAKTQIEINKLEEGILDLQLRDQQETSTLSISIRESFDNLISQIEIWEQDYVITAPISGIATFNKFWSENQNVNIGEKVLSIVPSQATNIVGKMMMPIKGSGKVKEGQEVNIKFYNYPYMEFGMVKGIIHNISTVPTDNLYTVEVTFPEGLRSNYNIELDFIQKMKGNAEIITEDISLLVRIVRPLRSLIKNRTFKDYNPPQ